MPMHHAVVLTSRVVVDVLARAYLFANLWSLASASTTPAFFNTQI